MTDVAVSVHCNPCDVENGTNDAQPHKEATDLNRKKESTVFASERVENGVTVVVDVENQSILKQMGSYHALRVSQCPSIMEEGIENEWVGVEGYDKVSKRQTHHKHIAWKGRHTQTTDRQDSYLEYCRVYSTLVSDHEMNHVLLS